MAWCHYAASVGTHTHRHRHGIHGEERGNWRRRLPSRSALKTMHVCPVTFLTQRSALAGCPLRRPSFCGRDRYGGWLGGGNWGGIEASFTGGSEEQVLSSWSESQLGIVDSGVQPYKSCMALNCHQFHRSRVIDGFQKGDKFKPLDFILSG